MSPRIVQYGCGVIGCSLVRLAAKKPDIDIVGAIDIINVGKDLGDIAGLEKKLGVIISNDAAVAISPFVPPFMITSILGMPVMYTAS